MPLNWYCLTGEILDIGTATTKVFVVPRAGYLREVHCVLNGAITTADDVITVAVDGTNLSPTITVTQSGSAAGDYDSATYLAAVKPGSRITLSNSGASTGTAIEAYTIVLSD
jgi:hypothetical protein